MLKEGAESQQNEIMSNFYQWLDTTWGSPNNTLTTDNLLKSYKLPWEHIYVSWGMFILECLPFVQEWQ